MNLLRIIPAIILIIVGTADATPRFDTSQNFLGGPFFGRATAVLSHNTDEFLLVGPFDDFGLLRVFKNVSKQGQDLDFEDVTTRINPNGVGFGAMNILVEDLNGDQVPDLVYRHWDQPSGYLKISYSLVDPITGVIGPENNLLSGQFYLSEPAVADIDGDGFKDVVVAKDPLLGSAAVEILLVRGQALGTFSGAPILLSTLPAAALQSHNFMRLDVGDADGDGDIDIVFSHIANNLSQLVLFPESDITLLENQGQYSFNATVIDYFKLTNVVDLKFYDYNGDGVLDIVSALEGDILSQSGGGIHATLQPHEIRIDAYIRTPSGYISQEILPRQPNPDLPLYGTLYSPIYGVSYFQTAFTDLNNDGIKEFLLSTPGQGLGVYELSSNGTYIEATASWIPNIPMFDGPRNLIGERSLSFSIWDFNKDGIPDIAIPAREQLLAGTGRGLSLVTDRQGFNLIGTGFMRLYSRSICIGNLVGDSKDDIVVISPHADIFVYDRDNHGGFSRHLLPYEPGVAPGDQCVVIDIDGDGLNDLFVFDGDPSGRRVYFNQGAGVFSIRPSFLIQQPQIFTAKARDLDGDGLAELILGRMSDVLVFWNGPTGLHQLPTVYPVTNLGQVVSLEFGDYDGNGTLDIIYQESENNTGVLLKIGASYVQNILGTGGDSLVIGDFNSDGAVDIFVTERGNNFARVYSHNPLYKPVIPTIDAYATAVADITMDGIPDILIGNRSPTIPGLSGSIDLLESDSSGNFIFHSDISAGRNANSFLSFQLATIDVDGDRDLDVIDLSYGDIPRVWLNLSSQLRAPSYLVIKGPTANFDLKIDNSAAGAVGLVLASLAPIGSGQITPFGELYLTNFAIGPMAPISSPNSTTIIPITLPVNATLAGQTLNIQALFFDPVGGVKFGAVQSINLL